MNGPTPTATRSSLRSDTLAYGAAMAVDRLTGFILLPLLTSAMDRSVFGAWNQVLTSFALLSNVLELGFYHAILRYVPGAARSDVGRIFYGMLGILAINSTIFIIIAALVPGPISQILFAAPEPARVIFMAAVFIVSECLFEFLVLGFLRADGRIRSCAIYYVIKNVLRLLLLWQGVLRGAGLIGLLELLTANDLAIVVVAYAIHIAPQFTMAISGLRPGFWKEAVRYSGTIVLSTNLSWANASLNRFLIVHLLNLAELGIYAANYSIASIVSVASPVINFTVVPHLNAAWNRGDKGRVSEILSTVTKYYCYVTLPTAVAIGVFYLPIARLLTAEQYIADVWLIWFLLAFMILLGLEQLTTFATFLDNSRFSVRVRALSLAVNIALNVALIGTFGISASAFAAALSTLIVVAMNHWFLRKMVGYEFPWRPVAVMIVAAAIMAGVAHVAFLLLPAHTFGYAVIAGFISLPVYLGLESVRQGSVTRQLLGIVGATAMSLRF